MPRPNTGNTQQIVRMAIGAAAAATAIFAPVSYKWKGVLSAIAVDGLLAGTTGFSPFNSVVGLRGR